jgi:hypothetical protein
LKRPLLPTAEDHPLRNLLSMMSFSISSCRSLITSTDQLSLLHSQFMALARDQGAARTVVLFGQGFAVHDALQHVVHTAGWDWVGGDAESELANWQVLFFSALQFPENLLHMAGNATWRSGCGAVRFDIKADFYYPFFANNLLEHWRRVEQSTTAISFVALILNPVLLKLGRKIKVLAYMIACFLVSSSVRACWVHLIPCPMPSVIRTSFTPCWCGRAVGGADRPEYLAGAFSCRKKGSTGACRKNSAAGRSSTSRATGENLSDVLPDELHYMIQQG